MASSSTGLAALNPGFPPQQQWAWCPGRWQGWRRFGVLGVLGTGLVLTPVLMAQTAWVAAIQPDPVTRQARCLLRSATQITEAGHEDTTPVTLVLTETGLRVITQSELDPSFNDLRLVVDDKPPLSSQTIINQTHLLFDQNLPELIQWLRSGRQATVYLRFWPTWPVTQNFAVRFGLSGFSRAHDSFKQNCPLTAAPLPATAVQPTG